MGTRLRILVRFITLNLREHNNVSAIGSCDTWGFLLATPGFVLLTSDKQVHTTSNVYKLLVTTAYVLFRAACAILSKRLYSSLPCAMHSDRNAEFSLVINASGLSVVSYSCLPVSWKLTVFQNAPSVEYKNTIAGVSTETRLAADQTPLKWRPGPPHVNLGRVASSRVKVHSLGDDRRKAMRNDQHGRVRKAFADRLCNLGVHPGSLALWFSTAREGYGRTRSRLMK